MFYSIYLSKHTDQANWALESWVPGKWPPGPNFPSSIKTFSNGSSNVWRAKTFGDVPQFAKTDSSLGGTDPSGSNFRQAICTISFATISFATICHNMPQYLLHNIFCHTFHKMDPKGRGMCITKGLKFRASTLFYSS